MAAEEEYQMKHAAGDAPAVPLATVFRIRLKQTPVSLRPKMRVLELCCNFRAVAWCGKLNVIACASETCARIPSTASFLQIPATRLTHKCPLRKSLSCQFQTSARWPHFLCVCSVFSSGSVQLHWGRCPFQDGAPIRWFLMSNGLLGAVPSGIMADDAIFIEAGYMHVTGVPLVNPSIVVWEVQLLIYKLTALSLRL